MRHILFITLITAFTFSINGMVEDPASSFSSPVRPPRAAAVPVPDLTTSQIKDLTELMEACAAQMENVHTIFSKVLEQPKIAIAAIRVKFTHLAPLLLGRLKPPAGIHLTPECRKTLGTHLHDIAGDDPREFLKKGEADFRRSVKPEDFYSITTHFDNTFFVPTLVTEPYFVFWRTSRHTLWGDIEHGEYNVLKMLGADNPESHSGACEWHHVYQNQDVVTLVCWSEHKGKTTEYHKSKSDSKIDRDMCKPEFYLINKLIGLLQIASVCERVLRTVDKDKLPEEASALMQWVRSYTGNITTIPNEHAVRTRGESYTIPDAFAAARTVALGTSGALTVPKTAPKRKDKKRGADFALLVEEDDDSRNTGDAKRGGSSSLAHAKRGKPIDEDATPKRMPLASLPINTGVAAPVKKGKRTHESTAEDLAEAPLVSTSAA